MTKTTTQRKQEIAFTLSAYVFNVSWLVIGQRAANKAAADVVRAYCHAVKIKVPKELR